MNYNEIEVYTYRGCRIRVQQDDTQPESPRDWDNLGTMACWHRRYNLGDVQPREEASEYIKGLPRGSIILPLYLYDHSGITMKTSAFSCPWDSGQVGIIHCSPEKGKKEFPTTRYWRKAVIRQLQQEIYTYDDFITGSVYGYVAETPDGEHIDSCWGYYGHDETKEGGYMIKDCAKPAIDSYVEENPVPEVGSKVHVTDVGDGEVTEIDFDNQEYAVSLDGATEDNYPMKDVTLLSEWKKQEHSNVMELAY